VTNPTPVKKRLDLSSEDDDDLNNLENFFSKMKTPSKSKSRISEKSPVPFVVPDSASDVDEDDFNQTTILNPDPQYSDTESSDSDEIPEKTPFL